MRRKACQSGSRQRLQVCWLGGVSVNANPPIPGQRPRKTAKQMHRKEAGGGTWPRPGAVTTCSVSWSPNSRTNRHIPYSYQCQPTHILTVICAQPHPPPPPPLHALTRPAQAVRQTVRFTAPLLALRATQADPASACGRGKSGNAAVKGARGGGGEGIPNAA